MLVNALWLLRNRWHRLVDCRFGRHLWVRQSHSRVCAWCLTRQCAAPSEPQP